jgi:hypothetical protein
MENKTMKFDFMSYFNTKEAIPEKWKSSLELLLSANKGKLSAMKVSGTAFMNKGTRKMLHLPTRSDELNILGTIEFEAGRYMSALAYFKDALRQNPDNTGAADNIERTLNMMKEFSLKTIESIDHEAAKTIQEIAVLDSQISTIEMHMELLSELLQSKRDYLQSLADKYNKITEDL